MNKKAKICLNAMVGNEAKTITRMLDSVAPYIDYWVIQCNGKEDNTKEIIENFFQSKNIPGFTYETDWNFPGFNRDHTLQTCLKSNHGCDWILRMDADERLKVEDDFDWSILENTSIQSFNIGAEAGDTNYLRTWLWNAKLPWFFQHDKRHETIHLPEIGENFERVNMPWSFRHLVSQDGETWFAPRKFLKDALELEIDKVGGNTILSDKYHLWYVAKSYADCYGNPSELPFGKQHSDEYARRALWYFERFFEHVHECKNNYVPKYPDEMAYFALIMMSQCYEFMGDVYMAEKCLVDAAPFSPERNENWFYLCILLEKQGKYEQTITYLDKMLQEERVNPFPRLSFLIENRAYHDTDNTLVEWKERITKRLTEFTIDTNSVVFDFN